jgi:predicted nucleotidyltransferase
MITDGHEAELKEIFVKHGVVLAYLFGSQAEGMARPSSDVDIAVLLAPDTPRGKFFDVRLRLINDLAEALHRNDTDVVVLNEATALLAHEVVGYGKLLYEDEATRPALDFTVSTIIRYADTAHFRKLAWDYLSETIEARRRASIVSPEKTA